MIPMDFDIFLQCGRASLYRDTLGRVSVENGEEEGKRGAALRVEQAMLDYPPIKVGSRTFQNVRGASLCPWASI